MQPIKINEKYIIYKELLDESAPDLYVSSAKFDIKPTELERLPFSRITNAIIWSAIIDWIVDTADSIDSPGMVQLNICGLSLSVIKFELIDRCDFEIMVRVCNTGYYGSFIVTAKADKAV